MAAQKKAPCFPGSFHASLQNFINNDIPIAEEFINLIPMDNLLQFRKAIINASYWNRRLLEEINSTTLILGFITFQGLQVFNVQQFLEILKTVIPIDKIEMIFPTESQNFMGVVLKDNITAEIILENLKNFGEATTIFIGKSDSKFIPIKIMWGTPSISIDNINQSLMPYFESIDIKRETIVFQGVSVPSGTIIGTVSLKPGLLLEKVPYILEINRNAKKRLLLVIKGRPPICLKCGEKGHIRKQCSALKCTYCRQFHASNFFCKEGQNRISETTKIFSKHLPGLNIDTPETTSNLTSLGKPKVHRMQKNHSIDLEESNKIPIGFNKEKFKKISKTEIKSNNTDFNLISNNPFKVLESLEEDFEQICNGENISEFKETHIDDNQIMLNEKPNKVSSLEKLADFHKLSKTVKRAREDEKEEDLSESELENQNHQLNQELSSKISRTLRSQKKKETDFN